MQAHSSRLVIAALLLSTSISVAVACPTDAAHVVGSTNDESTTAIVTASSDIEPMPSVALPDAVSHEQILAPLTTEAEEQFAFPNWVLLQDHEGEGFTALSAFQIGAFEDAGSGAEAETAERYGDPEETTGSISMIAPDELAIDGYEDR